MGFTVTPKVYDRQMQSPGRTGQRPFQSCLDLGDQVLGPRVGPYFLVLGFRFPYMPL